MRCWDGASSTHQPKSGCKLWSCFPNPGRHHTSSCGCPCSRQSAPFLRTGAYCRTYTPLRKKQRSQACHLESASPIFTIPEPRSSTTTQSATSTKRSLVYRIGPGTRSTQTSSCRQSRKFASRLLANHPRPSTRLSPLKISRVVRDGERVRGGGSAR